MALLPIPPEFGKGGANLDEGTPTLRALLVNLGTEILASAGIDATARTAAATAQTTANSAVTAAAAAAALGALNDYFTANLPNSDATIDETAGLYVVRAPAGVGTYTGNHNVTLSAATAPAKTELTILTEEANGLSRTMTVINGGVGGGNLIAFDVTDATKLTFVYDGTNWVLEKRTRMRH